MTRINFTKLALANSDDQFLAAIASIQRRGETVQLDIHLFLVAVASRWAGTGDVRPAVKMINKLVDALPQGIRSNAIKAWVETHLGFQWDQSGMFKPGDLKHSDLAIKKLANVRWWEFKPEPDYKPMDFTASVLTLIKKADDRVRKNDPRDAINSDILRAVKFAASGKTLGVEDLLGAIQALDPQDLAQLLAQLSAPQEQRLAA